MVLAESVTAVLKHAMARGSTTPPPASSTCRSASGLLMHEPSRVSMTTCILVNPLRTCEGKVSETKDEEETKIGEACRAARGRFEDVEGDTCTLKVGRVPSPGQPP